MGRLWLAKIGGVLIGTIASIWAVSGLSWPSQLAAERLAWVAEDQTLGVGTDLILLLAKGLHPATPLSAGEDLMLVSVFGWGVGAALLLSWGAKGRRFGWSLALVSPFAVALVASGMGASVPALIGIWRLLTVEREAPPDALMGRVGLALALGVLCVPGFGHFLAPFAALLFVWAPVSMVRRHMRAFYTLSFAPAFLAMAALAYIGIVGSGTARAMPPGPLPGLMPLSLDGASCLLALALVAPVLLGLAGRWVLGEQTGPFVATLIAGLTAFSPGVPVVTVLAFGVGAQAAFLRRFWGAPQLIAFAGSLAVTLGLDHL